MHSLFNLFASLGPLYSGTYGDGAYMISFAAAWVFAIVAFSIMRGRIRREGDIQMRARGTA